MSGEGGCLKFYGKRLWHGTPRMAAFRRKLEEVEEVGIEDLQQFRNETKPGHKEVGNVLGLWDAFLPSQPTLHLSRVTPPLPLTCPATHTSIRAANFHFPAVLKKKKP